jgi:hypothetical protein
MSTFLGALVCLALLAALLFTAVIVVDDVNNDWGSSWGSSLLLLSMFLFVIRLAAFTLAAAGVAPPAYEDWTTDNAADATKEP